MNEQILSSLHQKVSTVCEYNHSGPFQLYGLPGVLSTFNQTLDPESQKRKRIDIYGPRGLRTYLRTILHLSKSDIGFKFAVHELIPTKKQCPKNWKVLMSLHGDDEVHTFTLVILLWLGSGRGVQHQVPQRTRG